ncbi:MAG: phasin family protein [Bdellovibrionales bacterium]
MSNQPTNPFFDNDFMKLLDMSKFMDAAKAMDMSKMMDMSKFTDMGKMMNDCKMPNIDVETLMAAQRKGIEAMTTTNQKTFDTVQSYIRRQADLARQSMEATSGLVQAIMAAPTPEEKVAKQVEATKSAVENCVGSLKELSEILSQSQVQTMEAVSSAVNESLNGLQGMMKK